MILPMVCLPIIATGYVLKQYSAHVFLAEKRQHLNGVAALLVAHLEAQPQFGGWQTSTSTPDERNDKIISLNHELKFYTDTLAKSFPGVGVGYYHRELDAIITYGPSLQYTYTVGKPIPANHPGRQVLSSGLAKIEVGQQVRGYIMNAMRPLKIGGEVVGYVWANELIEDIDAQAAAMTRTLYLLTSLGLMLAGVLVYLVLSRLTRDVETIKQGLQRMTLDLNQSIEPMQGETGEIGTAINHMASALREARSMHHNILDSLADAVITLDLNSKITFINPPACALLGRRVGDLIGTPYAELFRSDQAFCSLLLDTLNTGQAHLGVELDYPLHERTVPVIASTSCLRTLRGQTIGAVAVIKDLTEKRALQTQIERAGRLAALGELASGIAHELRTPLTSIRGFVQYLKEGGSQAEWEEYGTIMIREIDRLNRIINQMLQFARPHPLNTGLLNANELVEETLLLINTIPSDKHVTLCFDLAPHLPPLQADGGQIKQVLLNLVVNAIQSMKEGQAGIITIKTFLSPSQMIGIEIADQGCGIAEAHLERIFDPFYSTKAEGTGLGLAVAKRIIEEHAGQLDVSSHLGKGTSITLLLPCAAASRE